MLQRLKCLLCINQEIYIVERTLNASQKSVGAIMDVTQYRVCSYSTVFRLKYLVVKTQLRHVQVQYRVVRYLRFHQMIQSKQKTSCSKSYDYNAEVCNFRDIYCMIILFKTDFIIAHGVFNQF
jgi:hypothetical protein